MRKTPVSANADTPKTGELLTVIIPCFNEEKMVEQTVNDVLGVAPELPMTVKILLIDDGSTDGTHRVMEDICREHPECHLVVNPRNLGLGRSVLNAYEMLEPETWVTVVPGDSEIVFDSIRNYMPVRDQYDLILGYIQNSVIRTAFRRLASYAFRKVVQMLYGFPYRYLNGLKMYRASCFKGIEVLSGGHAVNAELIAKALLKNPRLRIGEVPFIERGRARGTTKALRLRSVLRAIREVYVGYRSVYRYRETIIRGGASKKRALPTEK